MKRVKALKEFTFHGGEVKAGTYLRMSKEDAYHYKNLGYVSETLTPENRQKK